MSPVVSGGRGDDDDDDDDDALCLFSAIFARFSISFASDRLSRQIWGRGVSRGGGRNRFTPRNNNYWRDLTLPPHIITALYLCWGYAFDFHFHLETLPRENRTRGDGKSQNLQWESKTIKIIVRQEESAGILSTFNGAELDIRCLTNLKEGGEWLDQQGKLGLYTPIIINHAHLYPWAIL